jgi:hypothetical protein
MHFVFRSAGCGRFLGALFQATWLAVWGGFAWFAIRAMGGMARDGWAEALTRGLAHPVGWIAGTVAMLFAAGWAFGGLTAVWELLQLLFGVDELTATPEALTLRRGIGPFGIRRTFERSRIREVYVRRDRQVLMMETERGRRALTRLGTSTEREEAAQRLAIVPGPTLPLRWVATAEPDGTLCIGLRRIDGLGCLGVVAAIAIVSLLFALRFVSMLPVWGEATALAFALAMTALTLWGAFSRREWLVAPGRIDSRVRWLSHLRVKSFDPRSLRIDRKRDSDGDERVVLRGTIGGKKKTVYNDLNEDRDVVGLARFLEAKSGWAIPEG